MPGSKAVVGKLVREVLKLQENISNMMLKLISIENKMENMLQPSAPQTEERVVDQEFMVEPLKEMEDVKALENALLDPDNYYQLVTDTSIAIIGTTYLFFKISRWE